MANLRKAKALKQGNLFFGLLLGSIIWVASCGPFRIEHDVSGTVQIQAPLTPTMFEPFFLSDCATRTSGQQCYDVDPITCSRCMSTALFDSLGVK